MELVTLDIYTDGSAEKRPGGRLGCGAFCSHMGQEYTMSVACTREVLAKYNIPVSQPCSNPTSEFVAFVEVLKILRNTPSNYHLRFWIDYNGIGMWTTGQWRAKEPHIRAILQVYKTLMKTMKCQVSVEWLRGHSGVYGNDMADAQAGSYTTDTSQFEELATLL